MNINDLQTGKKDTNENGSPMFVQMNSASVKNINLLTPEEREELKRKRMENAPEDANVEEDSKLVGPEIKEGVHKFVPESVGIYDKPQEYEDDDIVKALKHFDDVALPKKLEEMERFNNAIDAAGEVTEEELMQMEGKEDVLKAIDDPRRIGVLKTHTVSDKEMDERYKNEQERLKEMDEKEKIENEIEQDNFGVGNLDDLNLPTDDASDENISINEDIELPDEEIDISEVEEDIENEEMEDEITTDGFDEETDEEITERFKKSIREKVSPVTKKFDISTYSVVTKPVSFSNASAKKVSTIKAARWALMSTGRPIVMRSFKSTELDVMNTSSDTSSRYMGIKKQYSIIYNHIVDKNKPKTVEAWAKANSFLDLDHIWFAIYKATFEGANFIPMECSDTNKCRNVFLSDDIPIMKMVKFKDDKAKEKFTSIVNQENNKTSGLYVSEVVPVSDDIAISLREPSIYNIVFETALLDEKFLESHQDLVSVCAYIDTFYKIDHESQSLIPIDIPVFENNVTKSYKTRINVASKVLDTLNSDQYRFILTLIDNINKRGDEIKYAYPETTCPKCGKTIAEQEQSPQRMVFLRHQLVTFAI